MLLLPLLHLSMLLRARLAKPALLQQHVALPWAWCRAAQSRGRPLQDWQPKVQELR